MGVGSPVGEALGVEAVALDALLVGFGAIGGRPRERAGVDMTQGERTGFVHRQEATCAGAAEAVGSVPPPAIAGVVGESRPVVKRPVAPAKGLGGGVGVLHTLAAPDEIDGVGVFSLRCARGGDGGDGTLDSGKRGVGQVVLLGVLATLGVVAGGEVFRVVNGRTGLSTELNGVECLHREVSICPKVGCSCLEWATD